MTTELFINYKPIDQERISFGILQLHNLVKMFGREYKNDLLYNTREYILAIYLNKWNNRQMAAKDILNDRQFYYSLLAISDSDINEFFGWDAEDDDELMNTIYLWFYGAL